MKRFIGVSLVAALAILLIGASPQQKQKTGMDQQKHMKLMEMMKDSSMMDMMMDHVASDRHMRMSMLDKMMSHATSDTSYMMEMLKTMTDDKEMHSRMMKMMDGGMMQHDGMMHHGMHGKSSDSKKPRD